MLKEDGRWGGGPTITITPDGEVRVEGQVMGDTLLKDNIVSINDIKVPNRTPLQKCLFAIQDKLLTGWIQETEDSPKIQIRGSLWSELLILLYLCNVLLGFLFFLSSGWVFNFRTCVIVQFCSVRKFFKFFSLRAKVFSLCY